MPATNRNLHAIGHRRERASRTPARVSRRTSGRVHRYTPRVIRTTLYISPHLDDVALSCAHAILARRARGERVLVCSLFTRTRNRTVAQRRAAEDAAAWRAVGATRIDLGYDDCPDRTGHPGDLSYRTIALEPRLDRALVADVRAALARVIRAHRPDELWFPLGIGGHIDHRTAFAARPRRATLPTYFYADRPYAFAPHLVHRRLVELGVAPRFRPIAVAALRRQLAAASMTAFLTDAAEYAATAATAPRREHRLAGLAAHTARHPRTARPAALELIATYRSQIRVIFGDRLAATYRARAGLAERYYTLTT